MKKIILTLLLVLIVANPSYAQISGKNGYFELSKGVFDIDAAKYVDGKSISSTKQFYYRLEKGCALFLRYSLNSYSLNKVKIFKYPNREIYSAFKTKGDEVEYYIEETGVYLIEFENNGITKRAVDYRIGYSTKNDAPIENTNVAFKTITDTIEGATSLGKIIYTDTSYVDVLDQKILVNSQSNLMSPPKAVVAFTLPKNTIKFSYYLEVSQEGVDKYKESINNLSNSSASLLSSVDPMLGLLLTGVSTIGTISGGEDVQFYLVENTQFISNSNLFLTDQPFQAIRNSKVYNDASAIDLLAGKNINGNWAFCLYNDNVVQSIDVALKVKAMCAKAKTIIQKTVPIIE
jgi:hypothetical protein